MTAVSFPASGAFIDVGDFNRFAFLIHAGEETVTQTYQVQQATAIDGALIDVVGAVIAIATGGKNKWYIIEVQCDRLNSNGGYHFVTLTNTGGAAGNFAALTFLGLIPGKSPVTQPVAVFGSAVNIVG